MVLVSLIVGSVLGEPTYVELQRFKDAVCDQQYSRQFVELGACIYVEQGREEDDYTYMFALDQEGALAYYRWDHAGGCNTSSVQTRVELQVDVCNADLLVLVKNVGVPVGSLALSGTDVLKAYFTGDDSGEGCSGDAPLFEVFSTNQCYFNGSTTGAALYTCADDGSAVSVQMYASLSDCMNFRAPVASRVQSADTCFADEQLALCGSKAFNSPAFAASASPFSGPATTSSAPNAAVRTTTAEQPRKGGVQYLKVQRFADADCNKEYSEEFVQAGACIRGPDGSAEVFTLHPTVAFYRWNSGGSCRGTASVNSTALKTKLVMGACMPKFKFLIELEGVKPHAVGLAANQIVSATFGSNSTAGTCSGRARRFEVFQAGQCYFLEDGVSVRKSSCTAEGAVLVETFNSLTPCMSQGPPQESSVFLPDVCYDDRRLVLCGANAFSNAAFAGTASPFAVPPRRLQPELALLGEELASTRPVAALRGTSLAQDIVRLSGACSHRLPAWALLAAAAAGVLRHWATGSM